MAVTPFTLTMSRSLVPLEGPSTPVRVEYPIPQYALIYHLLQSLPADGNQFALTVGMQLPANVVCLLTDFSAQLRGAEADLNAGWGAISYLEIQQTVQGGDVAEQYLACNSWGLSYDNSGFPAQRTYMMEQRPTYPLFTSDPITQQQLWYATSRAVIANNMQGYFFARWLVFDRQQFENWPIHTPAITLN